MSLRDHIVDEIRRNGPIPFSRYMGLCLYAPELGYYSRPREQFGKAGDFYTSSDVHAVFGRLLARQFDQMWRTLGSPGTVDVVELGPGRGLFAADVLAWCEKQFPAFAKAICYRFVESSPSLRARLGERFADRMSTGTVSIHSTIEEVPQSDNVILFGNEFFDALPVEVIAREGQLVIGEENGRFVEQFVPVSNELLDFLEHYALLPDDGHRVEAPLAAQDYMRRIASRVRRGFGVFIDYGYTREELLRGRPTSTVRAFRQHSISDTPYDAPGEQDITAHVNFSALRAAAIDVGMEHAALVTQSQFLIAIGEENQFADAFAEVASPQEQAKVALQLKHLVTPAGMGEMFQVMVLARGIPVEAVKGLSGLKFSRLVNP